MHKPLRCAVVVLGCLLASSPLLAQEPPAAPPLSPDSFENYAEFTVRGTAFAEGSDEARFMRYRDLRNGGTLDVLRMTKASDSKWFNVQADHVGYRDQRFYGALNNYGKLKVSGEWNQIPLFFSEDTRTLFTTTTPLGQLRIDDPVQSAAQTSPQTIRVAANNLAQPFDLRLKRSIGDVRALYSVNENLDLSLFFRTTSKTGSQPWAGTFGFSDAVELAVPVQTHTNEVGVAGEWANRRGLVRVGYDGSFFRNETDLVWDNPLRITDSPTAGPRQGRMSLWPDSNMNAANVSGMVNLAKNSRATAYLSAGNWTQNDILIPYTINTALPTIPLDRTTADTQAHVTSMNYTFSSRPSNSVWFSARYWSYDFENRTPEFHVNQTVTYDTTVATFAEGGTSPYSLNRKTFDADVSFTPWKHSAFRAGYTRANVSQTFRSVDETGDNIFRLSADTSGLDWLMLRAVYEHSNRVGSGFDEQVLDDIGEQDSLRQFDISDRTSNRVSLLVQVTPVSPLSLHGTISAGNEDRPDTVNTGTGGKSEPVFGLLSNDNHSYSLGVDYVPRQNVSFGAEYVWERYSTLQKSRQANPGVQFDDPTRDWTTDGSDKANTFTVSMDLLKLLQKKTDFRATYDYSHAETQYIYGLAPNTTLPPVVQLPAVINTLQRATADLRYHFTSHVGAGFVYWFDKYAVNDFASDAWTLTSIVQPTGPVPTPAPNFLMIGYLTRPYTAHTFSGRFTYYW
jgi:MtrB/PioB family decaheme-associated outer membrane protein